MTKEKANRGEATKASLPKLEVICETGRHVNCLHARVAAKRGK